MPKGSWDGQIRIWALDAAFRSFSLVSTIPAAGFVNGLQMLSVQTAKLDLQAFSDSSAADTLAPAAAAAAAAIDVSGVKGDADSATATNGNKAQAKGQTMILAAAVSQEPRLGRWMRVKQGVRNGLLVAALPLPN